MAFEEIQFDNYVNRPKMADDEITIRYQQGKNGKHYMRINKTLSKELIDGDFKYCALECDKETWEMRLKFRKTDGVKMTTNGKAGNLIINCSGMVKFIHEHLGFMEETGKITVSEDKSNVIQVQTRYIHKR